MAHPFKHSARALIAGILATILTPAETIAPSAWAARNIVVQDGPYKFQKFKTDLTPYLVEPMEFWCDDCADNKAVIRKSKQTGFTQLAIVLCGYTADVEPCDVMLIEPTESNLSDFISLKLQPTIDGSPALRKKISPQISRSARGSTAFLKRYPGGNLLMGIATSSADLRGKTMKKVIRDEASEYPLDLAGQGSPHDMITGAYESFLQQGDYKDLAISTPVVKGACFIDAEFEKGDQRFWHVPCPGCATEFVLGLKNFRHESTFPFKAHFVAECCGTVIEAHQKNDLVRKGRWIATAPAPGKFRSYHFDAFSSPFVPLDKIAERIVDAEGNPEKQKTLHNLTFGLAYEPKGDAPDHVKLLERREEYPRGRVPAQGLILVAGADVQHGGIWFEVVAFGRNGESWSVDHGFLEGATTDHNAGAFLQLGELYDRKFPDAFRGYRRLDAMAVDAGDGGRANQVYSWARTRNRASAIKGVPGWSAPAIGTPVQVDVTLNGRKIKGGAALWPVGTWSIKSVFYANLNKDGMKAGELTDPPGYCHYHGECDETFFKQQTAEFLKTKVYRGRPVRVWTVNGTTANHLLDCRVYAIAMAEYCGVSRMTEDQWARLAALRATPPELVEPDMLAAEPVQIAARPTLIADQADEAEAAPGITFRRLF